MKSKILLVLIFPFLLSGCDSLLDTYPYGQIDDEEMVKFQKYVSGLVGYAYEQIPLDYRNIEGNRLDCATDDAVLTDVNADIVKFAIGSINNSEDPFSSIWSSSYKAIANLNLFIQDDLGIKTKYYLDPELDEVYKKRLLGEAYGMRAFMQWRLLKFYGGIGIKSGKMLGYPIITEKKTIESEEVFLERNSYDDCVLQIINDCEKALELLPEAHRDFMYDSEYLLSFQKILGSCNWGRVDGLTINALLADLYLTYASPLFNPNNDMERWKKAAEYSKKVIDFKLNVDGNVKGGFNPTDRLNWFDACITSGIFISRRAGNSDANDSHERDFYPTGFRGNGILGATQDLVDAFPMSNGYPINHPINHGVYNPNEPYKNRDPRLYANIFYPGSKNKHDYTFETWYDEAQDIWGKDAPGLTKVSRTGYHIRKMVFPDLDWSASNIYKGAHVKHYYRWEHMILAFAEAANEYEGPIGSNFGMSAKEALKYLRSRKTFDNVTLPFASSDPYLDEVSTDKNKFRELVHNERRIELCFEGQRFFDLRRWNTDVKNINNPVHKINVIKKTDGTFRYEIEEIENRNFPSLFIPIPYGEILKDDKMEQNIGWETWSK